MEGVESDRFFMSRISLEEKQKKLYGEKIFAGQTTFVQIVVGNKSTGIVVWVKRSLKIIF
jgi:hypothetical protein